jgi:hypothetical protein
MYILLPMDTDEVQEAKLSRALEAKIWAQLLIEEGEVVEIVHSGAYDGFENFSEAVVLLDETENPMPFMELSMMPLIAPVQRTIDEIVEAYLFRELHDFPY